MSMAIFSGQLLICDIDGTLVNSLNQISQENLLAIHQFVDQGGKFTLASGRSMAAIDHLMQQLPVNMPVITVNGALITRLRNQEKSTIWECWLDDLKADQLIRKLADRFSGLGIEIFTNLAVYIVKDNPTVQWHAKKESILSGIFALEDIPRPWCKICLAGPRELLLEVDEFLDTLLDAEFYKSFSEDVFLDILNNRANKGEAVRVLQKMFGIDSEFTTVIGDNNNDISMTKVSGRSFAVANASPEFKQNATHLVCSNNEHGVAQAIARLGQELSR